MVAFTEAPLVTAPVGFFAIGLLLLAGTGAP
jgi:hypothetical protein